MSGVGTHASLMVHHRRCEVSLTVPNGCDKWRRMQTDGVRSAAGVGCAELSCSALGVSLTTHHEALADATAVPPTPRDSGSTGEADRGASGLQRRAALVGGCPLEVDL